VNTKVAAPACLLLNSNLTAESDTHSDTQGRPMPQPSLPDVTDGGFHCCKILTLDEVCDRYILYILNCCGGNRRFAASALGIGLSSLYRYLAELDREKRGRAISGRL
jgi:hypothetical protein